MAGETLGTIRGQMILDVKQALNAYTQARQAHITTVTALHTGAGAMMQSGAAIAGVGALMVGGFTAAIGAAAEFEKRLDFFGAVSATTQDEMDAIREKALQLGADTIYSANQIADSFIELGKSGVSAKDIIDGVGEGVAALGAAADIPLDTAANIITSAVATFQLGAENAVMVADKLAGAANASIVDVEDLGVSLKYVGGVAASLGSPFEDVNTALAILGENGIKGSTAGTSLRQIMLGLSGSTPKATEALKELGIITEDGANKFFTAEGKAKSLAEVFQILQDATAGMSDEQRTSTMQQIFATRALPSLIALTREGAAGFAEMADAINKTTAADVAGKRLDNLAGDIEILRGNIDTLLVSSGSGFQEFARMMVQGVTTVIQAFIDLPTPVQTAITAVVASFGGILLIVGTLGMFAGAIMNIVALAIQMGPVWAAMAKAWVAVSTAIKLASAAMMASPIGLIIGLIALLVGGLVALWYTSESFRNAVQPLFDGLLGVFQSLQPVITMVAGILANLFTTIASGAAGGLATVVGFFGQLASTLGGVLAQALAVVLPFFMNLVNTLMSGLAPVLQAVLPLIQALGAILGAVFSGNLAALPALMQNFTSAFQGMIGAIAGELIPAVIQTGTTIITTMIGMLPMIVEAGVQLITGIIQAIVTALPMIINAVLNLVTTLIATIITMIPMIVQAGLQLILGLLNALVTMLPMIIQAGLQLILGLIQGIVTAIPMIIQTVVALIPMLITALVTMIPMLIEAGIQLFLALVMALAQAIPQIVTALIDAVIQIVQALIGMIPMLIDAAIQLFLGLVLGLAEALPQIIEALLEAIPQLITALVSMIPQIIEAAVQLFLGLVTGLAEALPQIITAVIGMIPQIVQALINAVPQLVDAGVQLIQGLIDGVISMGGALWDAVTGLAQSAIDAVTGMFQEHSPSKVAFGIGAFFTEGLIDGIASLQNEAVRTATDLASSIASVPFQMAGLQEMYDSLASAQALSANLATGQLGVEAAQLFAIADKEPGDVTEINIDTVEVNNPEAEPTSDTLPRVIRDLAFMGG